VIDWFHIAMRFTVLKQMAKGISIADANPDDPDGDPQRRLLESAKWYLWHGNVHRSPERIDTLIELIEHDERVAEGPECRKHTRLTNSIPRANSARQRGLIPAAANAMAMPRPIPLATPVMTATSRIPC
jgi:hypothetical protein